MYCGYPGHEGHLGSVPCKTDINHNYISFHNLTINQVKLVKGQVDAQQVLDNVSQVPSRWSELLVYFLVYFPNSRSDAPRSILPLSPTEKQQSLDKVCL